MKREAKIKETPDWLNWLKATFSPFRGRIPCYPLVFWKTCEHCNEQFKKEWGLKLVGDGESVFLCDVCSKEEEIVKTYTPTTWP